MEAVSRVLRLCYLSETHSFNITSRSWLLFEASLPEVVLLKKKSEVFLTSMSPPPPAFFITFFFLLFILTVIITTVPVLTSKSNSVPNFSEKNCKNSNFTTVNRTNSVLTWLRAVVDFSQKIIYLISCIFQCKVQQPWWSLCLLWYLQSSQITWFSHWPFWLIASREVEAAGIKPDRDQFSWEGTFNTGPVYQTFRTFLPTCLDNQRAK